ncbi:MAG: autorepressor SdpR family transcription factor [Lachnospiraceae bacterium]|nr:autorepressor SdpR family transcription factor [Lachnospiraceae bacterium]
MNATMKALSDPTRRAILGYLREGSMTAGEIAEKFDMTAATVSHHLSTLKKADLIKVRKEKNFIYYSLNTSVLEEVLMWISALRGEDTDDKGDTTDENGNTTDEEGVNYDEK